MKRRAILAAALCLVFALSLAACNGGSAPGGTPAGGGDAGGGDAAWTNGGVVPDREYILVGWAAPMSGPQSIFMMPTQWVVDMMLDHINNNLGGIEINGRRIPLRVVFADNESNPTTAMAAAERLVTNDRVDILLGTWTPVGTNTASAVAERHQIPTFVFGAPEESWLDGGPYEWAVGMNFNYYNLVRDLVNIWTRVDTNGRVGLVLDTTVDGTVGRDTVTGILDELGGFEVVDPGAFDAATPDFTGIISRLRDEDVQIIYADMNTPNASRFWSQLAEFDFIPRVVTINRGLHYAADVGRLEPNAVGLTYSALWDRNYPFSSSLLGESAYGIAARWEDDHGEHYPYSLGYDVALFDILYDVLTRAGTLERNAVMEAFLTTNIDTVFGNVTVNENRNMRVPALGTQWIEGDRWPLQKSIVSADTFPFVDTNLPIVIPQTTQ
ncbi:MAG: ABC transporter substrate-binding protein [Oscillospiraceae bacterium]|nr:ABC transporter substrate-binding protein [Oscillospiraceae bacterium]